MVIELPRATGGQMLVAPLMPLFNERLTKSAYQVHAIAVDYGSTAGIVDYFQRLRMQDLAAKNLPKNFRKGILRVTP